jgi:hypothetical protein
VSNQGEPDVSEPLLIHLHIPKCAGTTVEKHLSGELGRSATWFPRKRTRALPMDLFRRKYDARPPHPLHEIKAISGHHIGQSIERMFEGRRIIRSIILREPESLMLSYYNYRMLRYIRLGQRPYSFSLFLRATRQNFISHFILDRWLELRWTDLMRLSDGDKIRLLDEAMSSIHHIAPIAESDAFVAKISGELGITPVAERRNVTKDKRETAVWKIVRLEDLSQDERAELRSRTQLDQYLWRKWVLKDNIVFRPETSSRFTWTELMRPRYQCERRFVRRFGQA